MNIVLQETDPLTELIDLLAGFSWEQSGTDGVSAAVCRVERLLERGIAAGCIRLVPVETTAALLVELARLRSDEHGSEAWQDFVANGLVRRQAAGCCCESGGEGWTQ